jgi:hypothetical protein
MRVMPAFSPPGSPKLVGQVPNEGTLLILDARTPEDWQHAGPEDDAPVLSVREVPSVASSVPAGRPGGEVPVGHDRGVLVRCAGAGPAQVYRINETTLAILRGMTELSEGTFAALAARPIESGDRFASLEVRSGGVTVLAFQETTAHDERVRAELADGAYACVYDEVSDGEAVARRFHLIHTADLAQKSLF